MGAVASGVLPARLALAKGVGDELSGRIQRHPDINQPQRAGGGGKMRSYRQDSIDINSEFSKAIASTRQLRVVYEDILGEGPDAWHPGPRYPSDKVNCLTWLQLVISEIYAATGAPKQLLLDRLRYYGGHVGFATRKHFIEHWLAFDPQPLVRTSFREIAEPKHHRSVIEPFRFAAYRNFEAPFYHMHRTTFQFEYYDQHAFGEVAKRAPAGFYVVFAVPTPRYIDRFCENVGPLGLVHAIILELTNRSVRECPRSLTQCFIHHASVPQKSVVVERLDAYFEKSIPMHQGYVIYQLNPEWRANHIGWDAEAARVAKREGVLDRNVFISRGRF